MKRIIIFVMAVWMLMTLVQAEEASPAGEVFPLPVKVLLLPKFEIGEMSGDFPGEAQLYYEHYLDGAEEYDLPGGASVLYYRDGVAMCLTGMGKVSAAISTMAVLSDSRFDFTDAFIISTGCAGSSAGTTVMGDVFVITSAVDYDLGHHADARDIEDPEGTTWFHDAEFDDVATVHLDAELMDKVYELVKDMPVETTEVTRNYMRTAFDGADWAVRDPMVLRGTAVSADNYWKGAHGHENALLMTETYQCRDPYAVTEMEDVAVGRAAKTMGLLDHLIIIRGSVNMDTFMLGAGPESLWGEAEHTDLASEESVEAADIFQTSMKNTFEVGRIIIDHILAGEL